MIKTSIYSILFILTILGNHAFAQKESETIDSEINSYSFLDTKNYSQDLNIELDNITSTLSLSKQPKTISYSDNSLFEIDATKAITKSSMPIYKPNSTHRMIIIKPDSSKSYSLLTKIPEWATVANKR